MMSCSMDAIGRDLGTLFNLGAIGGLSDGQLLGRFVERGEAAAFEVIVHRYGPMVWGVCRRVLRDRHDAEDAFQATFLVLARKAASVLPREKLGNWLYGVAYQTARKARAMRHKRRGRERQGSDMPEPTAVPDDRRDALAEALDRELNRLAEKYRIPVILCDLEGKTHEEAARHLGWPVGTVSSRLSRGRRLLAGRLSRPGVTLTAGSLAFVLARDAASASAPTKLVGSTAQAASLIAAGGAVTAGVVSAEVAALAIAVQWGMNMAKLKAAVLTLLVAGMVATGMGVLAQDQDGERRANDGGPPRQKAAPRKDAVVGGETVAVAHDVGDLLVPPGFPTDPPTRVEGAPERQFDMKPLVDLVTSTVAPETWKENQGAIGSILPLADRRILLISHNQEVQSQVKTLLNRLRRLREAQAANVGMNSNRPGQ